MGSKSRSRTSSTNITKDLTTNNVDNRVASGDASIGGNINVNLADISAGGEGSGGVGVNITTSDFGALDTANDIADSAFEFSSNAVSELSGTVSGAVGALRQTAQDSVQVAESAARDESARTMQFAILGLAIVGIAFALRKQLSRAS